MFVGWWQLLRNPKGMFRRPSVDAETPFVGATSPPGIDIPPAEKTEDKHAQFEDHGSSEEINENGWQNDRANEEVDREEYERKRTSATLVGSGHGIAL